LICFDFGGGTGIGEAQARFGVGLFGQSQPNP
jgi:hypothetical protein